MQKHVRRSERTRQAIVILAVGAMLTAAGCGLDGVDVPGVRGPSELALSLTMVASPDLVAADGASSSVVTVTARDRDGRLLQGQTIYFVLDGPGSLARDFDITDANGVASTTFIAPAGGGGNVVVYARPIGTDAGGERYRFVTIELYNP